MTPHDASENREAPIQPGVAAEQARRLEVLLRRRIETRQWLPGHITSGQEIAREFGLPEHRIPAVVVPAVKALRKDGLVETRPGVGIRVVTDGTTWDPPGDARGLPRDQSIELALRARLYLRVYPAGDPFPSYVVLGREFGVSVATVRKAVRRMQQQGLLHVVDRRRQFVSVKVPALSRDELLVLPERRNPGRRRLAAFGESLTMADWAVHPRCVVDHRTLYERYVVGWDLERALQTPKAPAGNAPGNAAGRARRYARVNAAQVLRARIKEGVLPAGSVLCLTGTARELGVPEPRVRDALHELHRLGLLTHRPGTGYSVTDTTPTAGGSFGRTAAGPVSGATPIRYDLKERCEQY
ncbi:GntR family transcriptional regulator [Streptomyces sp. NPDC091377]|uniref:GntR family transcriptional regulator n=1 Tax=Streptomyces sp. NPDC091377 TaxID=3365995 RepID=UPI003820EB9F